MYFKVTTSAPYRAHIWTPRTDRHPLKTTSQLIFLNLPPPLLTGGSLIDKFNMILSFNNTANSSDIPFVPWVNIDTKLNL